MRLQEVATSVGVKIINYGEETQARYQIKISNNMGQHDVIFVRSKSDMEEVLRELMAQDASNHAAMHKEGYLTTFAKYIEWPNPFAYKTVLGTCRKAAKAMAVEQLIEDYNATHSQVLTINRQK